MQRHFSWRPAIAFLSRRALAHNVKEIRKQIRQHAFLHHPKAQIMAIVKANAYGHHTSCIVPELLKHRIRFFAVASLEEAMEVRNLTSQGEILILGGISEWSLQALSLVEQLKAQVAINDMASLKFFLRHPHIPIHLKLDTGMNRLGLKPSHWGEACEWLKRSKRPLKGLFTHFATTDNRSFRQQVLLFNEVAEWFWNEGIRPQWIHSENSSALFSKINFKNLFLSEKGNGVRPGLSLYGYCPSPSVHTLIPVLELTAEVGLIKKVEQGEGISYGHLYKATREHNYAVVPLGYADGLSKEYAFQLKPELRTSKNTLKGLLNICGAICMDMVMVRSQSAKIHRGDRVIFWGRFPNPLLKHNLINPYELNLRISQRIPRVWVS